MLSDAQKEAKTALPPAERKARWEARQARRKAKDAEIKATRQARKEAARLEKIEASKARWNLKFSIRVCPRCKSPTIKVIDGGYMCQVCGAVFQKPARQKPQPVSIS